MIPMGEILKYLEAIRNLVGDDYSIHLTIQKNDGDSEEQPDKSSLNKLAQIFSPSQPSTNNTSNLDILDSAEIKRRIVDVLSTFRESKG